MCFESIQKKFLVFFFNILLIFSNNAFSADYYWVGNSGNWGDFATHWATSSGGVIFHPSVPSTNDNVFFDANSFSSGGQTVTIDVNASCANLDFSGVLNTPTIGGANSYMLTCAGNLTFVAGMNYSFAGDVNFVGTGVQTIISAGKTFAANTLFNGMGGQWTFQDAFAVIGQLGLQAGILDMNGVAVSCGTLNANIVDNARTITFGSSTVTVTGASTCVDLRGNTTNLVVNAGTATISCTTTSNIIIEVGTQTKTIPNLLFPNITTGSITITSGISTNRITFGSITKSTSPSTGSINIDDYNGACKKTFGDLSFPDNCTVNIRGGNGTSFGATDGMIYAGTVTIGNSGNITLRGHYAVFQQAFTVGDNTTVTDYSKTKFIGLITTGTSTTAKFNLHEDTEIDGGVLITGDTYFTFDYIGPANINSTFTVADDAVLTLELQRSFTANFNGNFIVGNRSSLILMDDGTPCSFNFLGTLICNTSSRVLLQNTVATVSINNLTLSDHNRVYFNSLTTNVTGTFTSTSSCSNWNWLGSSNIGNQALVSFSSPQTITGVMCQDINVSSTNLTNNNGVDLSNNTGITFGTPLTTQTFYWVGATTGNTKTGTFSTGVNNNWSNPDNWSLAGSGVYTGTNSCIPGGQDNVIFDAASFSAGAADVNADISIFFMNDIIWTGIPAGVTFDNGTTTDTRIMFVYGDFTWGGSNMTNNFEGTTLFSAVNTTGLTLTNNSTRFYGPVEFNYPGVIWVLTDNMLVRGGIRGDITITSGTLNAGNNTIALDDDWTVESSGTYTFTPAGSATIIFDGPSTTGEEQYIIINGTGNFNNLTVTRSAGTLPQFVVSLVTPIAIDKNLNITGGTLEDRGYQITGNATGTLNMLAGSTRLYLGATGLATLFPTNYIASNISLSDGSIVNYRSNIPQRVSGVPDYGYLQLSSATASMSTKILSEAVLINAQLTLNNNVTFLDSGFQISFDGIGINVFRMDAISNIYFGTAASATTFPPNFTAGSVDIDAGCTVVYNGGVAQTIQALNNGSGDNNYSHLQLIQPGVGSVTKTLNGNTLVRGNLTIGIDNVMDVSGSNYTMTIKGNWIDNGSFTPQTGLVTFNGTAQTVNAGGSSENFYDVTLNNTTTTISNGNIIVGNTLTLIAGKVLLGTNNLIISSGNAIVGSSSSNYIVTDNTGVLQINNITASRNFPIGSSTSSYTPVVIINAGTVDDFNARVFSEVYIDGTSGTQLTADVVRKTWMIDEGVPGGSDVTLTVQWNLIDEYGTFDRTSCGISHYESGNWDLPPYAVASGVNPYTLSRSGINSFSPFAVEESSHPLPITLLKFTAENIDNEYIKLNWSTASEINNNYFRIERSKDGITFESIGTVEGSGNSNVELYYVFYDTYPYPGTSYYRLKQVDFDAKYSYSEMVAVFIGDIDIITIYPNPAIKYISYIVSSTRSGVFVLRVLDMEGKEVLNRQTIIEAGVTTNKISIEGLSNGTYVLQLSTYAQEKTQKQFVVK